MKPTARSTSRRGIVFAGGFLLVAVYVFTAAATFRSGMFPVRPLYDGDHGQTQPYRWVSPPDDVAATNVPPEPLTKDLPISAESGNAFASTPDGQAAFIPAPNSFAEREGQTGVRVTLEPLAPDMFGKAPEGLAYDGNAYRFAATYIPSGEEAAIDATSCDSGKCPTFALTYPNDSTVIDLWRLDDGAWTKLESTRYGHAKQVNAMSEKLGVFVVLHKPADVPRNYGAYTSFALGLVAILAATMVAARRARAHDARGKKPPPKRTRKAKVRAVKRWLRS